MNYAIVPPNISKFTKKTANGSDFFFYNALYNMKSLMKIMFLSVVVKNKLYTMRP